MRNLNEFITLEHGSIGLCSRKNLPTFNRVWEECAQEEARLEARKVKLSDNEDQALATNVGKRRKRKISIPQRRLFSQVVQEVSKVSEEQEGPLQHQVLRLSEVWTLLESLSSPTRSSRKNGYKASCPCC